MNGSSPAAWNGIREDRLMFGRIILEVKSWNAIVDEFIADMMNYLAALGLRPGLLVNVGKDSLEYKKVVL